MALNLKVAASLHLATPAPLTDVTTYLNKNLKEIKKLHPKAAGAVVT